VELPKERQNGREREVLKIQMHAQDLINKLGPRRAVDQYLTRRFELEKREQFILNNFHLSSRDELDATRKAQAQNTKLFLKIFSSAIQKVRNIVPQGWMLMGNFESVGIDSTVTFYIKRDLAKPVINQETYYHLTKLLNLPNIKKNGLTVASNKRLNFSGYRNKIFLSTVIPEYEFAHFLMTGSRDRSFTEKTTEVALLKIMLPADFEVYEDDEATDAVFVEKNIPSQFITVVYTGPLSQLPS